VPNVPNHNNENPILNRLFEKYANSQGMQPPSSSGCGTQGMNISLTNMAHNKRVNKS
jgi:hypothetical protein